MPRSPTAASPITAASAFWNDVWKAALTLTSRATETYQNLTFQNVSMSGNGLGFKEGAALMIKARNDGATYGLHPASLTNVTIEGGTFTGN